MRFSLDLIHCLAPYLNPFLPFPVKKDQEHMRKGTKLNSTLPFAAPDMRFPLDGSVELYFTHSPEERPRTVSNVSCDKSPCAIASWDSYENINFTVEQVDEPGKVIVFILLSLPPLASWPRGCFVLDVSCASCGLVWFIKCMCVFWYLEAYVCLFFPFFECLYVCFFGVGEFVGPDGLIIIALKYGKRKSTHTKCTLSNWQDDNFVLQNVMCAYDVCVWVCKQRKVSKLLSRALKKPSSTFYEKTKEVEEEEIKNVYEEKWELPGKRVQK